MANCAACSRSARRWRRAATRARWSSCPKARTAPTRRPPPSPATRSRTSPPPRAGRVDLEALKARLGPDVAAVMITNPNTCGLFEPDMIAISRGGPRRGRLRLLRRRQFQRDRRPGAAGRSRHRRDAHQPAQDLLDPAWRRRAGLGAGGVFRSAGAVRAAAVRRARTGATAFHLVEEETRRRASRPAASAGWSPSTARWACSPAR